MAAGNRRAPKGEKKSSYERSKNAEWGTWPCGTEAGCLGSTNGGERQNPASGCYSTGRLRRRLRRVTQQGDGGGFSDKSRNSPDGRAPARPGYRFFAAGGRELIGDDAAAHGGHQRNRGESVARRL